MASPIPSSFDPRTPDSYAIHLANTGGGAIATRDIHNENGVLLVKKGFTIKADTAARLLTHKLVQPLETSVGLEEVITAESLFKDISAIVNDDNEALSIHQTLDLGRSLRRQCRYFASYPLLAQKITVLSSRLRFEYTKAAFCAWFALALTEQMGCSEQDVSNAFLAALVHDTGLLHIDPAIVEKTGSYTPEEWRTLQSHSLIADLFLSYVEDLPAAARRAVREHHERSDGSGYPAALFGDKLGILGQVVAVADSVWAIRRRSSTPASTHHKLSLGQIISAVKMNLDQHPKEIDFALYQLHQRAALAAAHSSQRNAGARESLIATAQQLQKRFLCASQLRGLLSAERSDRFMHSAYLKLERLWFVVQGSGLLSDSLAQWLSDSSEGKAANRERDEHDVRELELMYGELHWQLAQFGQILQLALLRSGNLNSGTREALQSVVEMLSKPAAVTDARSIETKELAAS